MLSRLIDKPWKLVVLLVSETVIFFVVLWYSIPIVAGNEAVYNGITILWLALLGITIYLYGDVTKKPKSHMMGFALMLFIIFFIIDRYEGFAVKFSAYAALLVAFAAFVSIDENRRLRADNRRIREEVLIQERHRQALERIRDWAEVIIEILSRRRHIETLFKYHLQHELDLWLQTSRVKGFGILKDAEKLGGSLHSDTRYAYTAFLKFGARLTGEKEIAEFKTMFSIENEIKPISNDKELEVAKRELATALTKVINSATDRLIPSE